MDIAGRLCHRSIGNWQAYICFSDADSWAVITVRRVCCMLRQAVAAVSISELPVATYRALSKAILPRRLQGLCEISMVRRLVPCCL